MGQPVVHFEVIGNDVEKLKSYYSDLFGWEINSDNPSNYGIVQREANISVDGIGIGGGFGQAPEGYSGHITFYIEVPDVETALVATPYSRRGGSRKVIARPLKIHETIQELGGRRLKPGPQTFPTPVSGVQQTGPRSHVPRGS